MTSDIELQKGDLTSHWSSVFQALSELDQEVKEGQEPTINIKKLRSYLRSQSSYKVKEKMF